MIMYTRGSCIAALIGYIYETREIRHGNNPASYSGLLSLTIREGKAWQNLIVTPSCRKKSYIYLKCKPIFLTMDKTMQRVLQISARAMQ